MEYQIKFIKDYIQDGKFIEIGTTGMYTSDVKNNPDNKFALRIDNKTVVCNMKDLEEMGVIEVHRLGYEIVPGSEKLVYRFTLADGSYKTIETPLQQIQNKLATEMAQKWEQTVKDVFCRKTGEELTMENADRVQIIKVINDPNEYYHIDGKLAITLYPIEIPWPMMDEMYKVTASRNYKEHE